RIAERLAVALAKIDAAEQAGRRPGISFLYERGRLVQLSREVQDEMRRYGARAVPGVERMMAAGGAAALALSRDSVQAAAATLGQAGADLRRIPPFRPELVERARAHLAEGSPVAELFAKFGPDAARRVEAGIV